MEGKTYLLSTRKTGIEIIFKYDSNNILRAVICESPITEKQFNYIGEHLPFLEWELADFSKGINAKITEIMPDLSFERFWNAYGYKHGKKQMARSIWKQLPDTEKAKALAAIKPYKNHVRLQGIQQAYPTTYLNQKYYENYGA